MNKQNAADWMGLVVVQVSCDEGHPEFKKHVGRTGTASEALVDEVGNLHIKTREDGVWCPARHLEVAGGQP
jgi:hypothetical protein